MFLHIYKYRLMDILRNKDLIFWSLLFPLILGTLFYFAFSNLSGSMETLQPIPVAVVKEEAGDTSENFMVMLEEMSREGDSKYLTVEYASQEEANSLLNKGTVDGIIQLDSEITLVLSKEGINQSILKGIVDSYLQMESMIQDIAQNHPDQLAALSDSLMEDASFNQEVSLGGGTLDSMVQYFYALIAMACMYGCFFGMFNAIGTQANLSPLGARRCISPTHKLMVTLGDFTAAVTIQFTQVMVLLFYLTVILKVDFGGKIGLVILTGFVGSIVGVAFGVFIGSFSRASAGVKQAIMIGSTMLLCFLSGLMYGNMRDIIEHHVPIINRINPAALITDALYSLSIYNTYTRFTTNMVYLLLVAFVLCFGSFLMVRREKYASL